MGWITVNGAHIEVKDDGSPVGRFGKKIMSQRGGASAIKKAVRSESLRKERGKAFIQMHKAKQAVYDSKTWGKVSGSDLGFYR